MRRFALASALSGVFWAGLAWLVAGSWPSDGAYVGGVLAAPAIGCAVGFAFTPAYHRHLLSRAAVALACLYLGAGLFGVALGLTDALVANPLPARSTAAVVAQTVLGTWWGLTFTGLALVGWPVAMLNHDLVGRLLPRDAAPG